MSSAPDNAADVCIAIGSNLGDRPSYIRDAVLAIDALERTTLVALSTVHETAPVGPPGQQAYLNAAVRCHTGLEPRPLLNELAAIERSAGRVRTPDERWGPRTLDLDILLYGDLVLNEPGLTIPHPRMHERRFVLAPLAEIAADVRVPTRAATVAELLAAIPSDTQARAER